MSDVEELNWPEEVELPERIGARRASNNRGLPVCSMGHFSFAVMGRADASRIPIRILNEFEMAFVRCSRALVGDLAHRVIDFNDEHLKASQRPLVYAAAWALCGYRIHNYPEAEELARRAGA